MDISVEKWGSVWGTFPVTGTELRPQRNFGCLCGTCHSGKPDPLERHLHRSLEITHCEILSCRCDCILAVNITKMAQINPFLGFFLLKLALYERTEYNIRPVRNIKF